MNRALMTVGDETGTRVKSGWVIGAPKYGDFQSALLTLGVSERNERDLGVLHFENIEFAEH